MKHIWNFIVIPQNLAALAAIGGLVGFLWHEFIPPRTPDDGRQAGAATSPAQSNTANARDNGVIVQGSSAGQDIKVSK